MVWLILQTKARSCLVGLIVFFGLCLLGRIIKPKRVLNPVFLFVVIIFPIVLVFIYQFLLNSSWFLRMFAFMASEGKGLDARLRVWSPAIKLFKESIWLGDYCGISDGTGVSQLLIIYFFPGLVLHNPIWGGGETGRFLAASVSFILNYACYFSEIYRGGIQSVPVGQEEAGLVLGMTKSQIFFRVKLLQMVKRIIPPMSNEILTLVKDTSLARIIALQEIIWAGQAFMKGSQGISGQIWPLFFTAIYYLIFNGILTVVLGKLEKKLDYFR